MNNWLLFALISFIVYIPSLNASKSSSSSRGGRRSGKGGKPGLGLGKDTVYEETDDDYRDLLDYITKESGKDGDKRGNDYDKRQYSRDGTFGAYPKKKDDYRYDADGRYDGGYPPYIPGPPSYIPYPAPGDKGGLSSGLLLQLTETVHEQASTIAGLESDVKKLKREIAELDATQYHLIGNIITLTTTLQQLIGDLRADITPPSLGIRFYICTGEAANCETGSIVAMAGPLGDSQDGLVLADGMTIIDDDSHPSVCDQLSALYGDAGDDDDTTCLPPDLRGKYLVGAGSSGKKGVHADLGEHVGSKILDLSTGDYEFPSFPKPRPQPAPVDY